MDSKICEAIFLSENIFGLAYCIADWNFLFCLSGSSRFNKCKSWRLLFLIYMQCKVGEVNVFEIIYSICHRLQSEYGQSEDRKDPLCLMSGFLKVQADNLW